MGKMKIINPCAEQMLFFKLYIQILYKVDLISKCENQLDRLMGTQTLAKGKYDAG